MTDLTEPLLIVDRIETGPEEATAEVRIAGRRERVRLGMPKVGGAPYEAIISYVEIPPVLSHNEFALRGVVGLVRRAHAGEPVSLPADLSALVRDATEEWPVSGREYRNLTDGDRAPISIEVLRTAREVPGVTTVFLRIAGNPTTVTVDQRGAPEDATRFRFVSGVHPWQLDPAESYAMVNVLTRATA